MIDLTHRDYQNAVDLEKLPHLYGRVLNLGLGVGTLADKILKQSIDELVSIEIEQGVIDAYDNTDERHTIIKGDALKYLEKNKDKFNFIIQDLPVGNIKGNTVKTDGWEISQ